MLDQSVGRPPLVNVAIAVVTCKIISNIFLKLYQCSILHVTTSETEIKLFQPLKEF